MSRKAAFVLAILLACPASLALINIRFTPRHLVNASESIVVGSVARENENKPWTLSISEALKGGAKLSGRQELDLAKCHPDHLKAIVELLSGNGSAPVILFAQADPAGRLAALHVAGKWISAKESAKNHWEVSGFANQMTGTFAGGTDMLVRMSKYLVNSPNADVPVSAAVNWVENCVVAKLDPRATLAATEYPQGKTALFAGSPTGDKLFVIKADGSAFDDVTAAAKLTSASVQFVFMDVDGDGLADLVSFNGKSIVVLLAGKEFHAAGDGWSLPIEDCMGIAPCSANSKPGLVISTKGDPVLLSSDEKGWKRLPLPAFEGDIGARSACIVADLDNDGFVDILQPGENAGILWRGQGGGFAPPVRSQVCTGPGLNKAAVADYNQDGFLDIFLAGREKNSLWDNDGKGGFTEVLRFCGSLGEKTPAGASDVKALDLNHDGRPDLCLAYAVGNIQYHFNRGFRSFGEEGELRLPGVNAGAANERAGQHSIATGDFNADGSLDLAVLLADGTLRVYFNDRTDAPMLLLRLPKEMTGPVTAVCWMDEPFPVATGVAAVGGYSPGAALPVRNKGDVVIKYRFPGGELIAKKVNVGERTTEVILTVDGK
ncbi:MAG TPA: VCBS repeat-containing protein [Planctomycetota bacterium]